MADDRVVIEIVLDDGSVQKGFAHVKRQGDKTAKGLGKSFTKSLGGAFVKLGAAFAGFSAISKITRDLVEFGKATAEIRTITKGLNIDQKELNKTLIETSQRYGTTATEQANAFYQIISAGITDAAKANELLISANKLAVGGLTTTTGAIDLLTSTINAFGQENISAEKASDVLFTTVRLGKTRIEELQSSFGQIAPTAAALGVSIEDVLGGIAQLTTKGVSTSESVTQLNAVFTALLKKQGTAGKILEENADLFTIQALKTKGLAGFLRDLTQALGGSEEKLVQLLGRSEGAKAIISAAGDDFKTLEKNVAALGLSAGAADEAFKEVDETLGQQLKRTVSIFSGQILTLTSQTEGPLVGAVTALNDALTNLGRILRFTAIAAISFIAVFKGGAIFKTIQAGILSTKGSLTSLGAQVRSTIVVFRELKIAGFTTFKALTTVIKTTQFGLKAFRVALKLTKAVLTFGITIAIDFLIEKFLELQDKVGGIGNAFKAIGLQIKIGVLGAIKSLADSIIKNFPNIAKKIGITKERFGSLAVAIGKAKAELRLLNAEAAKPPKVPKPDPPPPPPPPEDKDETVADKIKRLREELVKLSQTTPEAFATVGSAFSDFKEGFQLGLIEIAQNARASFQAIGKAAVKGVGTAVGNAFGAFGRALAEGDNALDAFLNSLLASFGQMAIQLGTQFILTGIAYSFVPLPNAGALIAAGAALATFGGVLSAVGGGGGVGPSSSGVGAAGEEEIEAPDILTDDEDFQRQSAVTVNVEGTVLDPVGVGTQIAELLSEVTDSNDIKVNV